MKPDLPVILGALAHALQGELAAQLASSYAGQQVLRISSLMPSFAIEIDRAASRRVEENKALRKLFAEAAPRVNDPTLKQDLLSAAQSVDDDLRISALQSGNDGLRSLLIRLHAWAERQDEADGKDLIDAIWLELKLSTERRALPVDRPV